MADTPSWSNVISRLLLWLSDATMGDGIVISTIEYIRHSYEIIREPYLYWNDLNDKIIDAQSSLFASFTQFVLRVFTWPLWSFAAAINRILEIIPKVFRRHLSAYDLAKIATTSQNRRSWVNGFPVTFWIRGEITWVVAEILTALVSIAIIWLFAIWFDVSFTILARRLRTLAIQRSRHVWDFPICLPSREDVYAWSIQKIYGLRVVPRNERWQNYIAGRPLNSDVPRQQRLLRESIEESARLEKELARQAWELDREAKRARKAERRAQREAAEQARLDAEEDEEILRKSTFLGMLTEMTSSVFRSGSDVRKKGHPSAKY